MHPSGIQLVLFFLFEYARICTYINRQIHTHTHTLQMIAQSLIIYSSLLPYDNMEIVMICLFFGLTNGRLNLIREQKKGNCHLLTQRDHRMRVHMHAQENGHRHFRKKKKNEKRMLRRKKRIEEKSVFVVSFFFKYNIIATSISNKKKMFRAFLSILVFFLFFFSRLRLLVLIPLLFFPFYYSIIPFLDVTVLL